MTERDESADVESFDEVASTDEFDEFDESDEFDEEAWIDAGRAEADERARSGRRRARMVGGAMVLGMGRALQQIYERPPPEPDEIVWVVDDDEPLPERAHSLGPRP